MRMPLTHCARETPKKKVWRRKWEGEEIWYVDVCCYGTQMFMCAGNTGKRSGVDQL